MTEIHFTELPAHLLNSTFFKDVSPKSQCSWGNLCKNRQLQGNVLSPLHCLFEWNKLDPEVGLSPEISAFKNISLSLVRPLTKPIFSTHYPRCLVILTHLNMGLSKLQQSSDTIFNEQQSS